MTTEDDKTPSNPPSNEVEQVFAEFLHRREAGSSAGIDELCQGHPGIASELRQLWDYWTRVEGVLGILGSTSDPASMPELLHGVPRGDDLPLGGDEPPPADAATDALYERLETRRPPRSRYRIGETIGEGGMGCVQKAWDEDLHRHVAMKTILDRKKSGAESRLVLARFLEEAQITGQLDHPGVVPVHELGVDSGGRVFFTMAMVRGHHLGEIFEHYWEGKEGWTLTRVLGVLIRVCEALAYAHSKGVVHRDLKPANIMVGRFGQTYVMDWGLARVLGRRDLHDLRIPPAAVTSFLRTERDEADSPVLTRDGHRLGTLCYMSPEQAASTVDQVNERSDIYSVGAILYHLLAGHPPYLSEGQRTPPTVIQARILQGPPERVLEERPDAPPDLVAICEKAMQREPAARYGSVLDLARDLEAYLGSRPVTAAQPGLGHVLRLAYRRNRALALTGLAAAVLLLAALVAFVDSVQQSLRKTDAELALLKQVASTQGDLTASLAAVEEYLAIRPADVDMLLEAVRLRALQGANDEAAELARGIARDHPEAGARAAALLGIALRFSDPDRAREYRESARQLLGAQENAGDLYLALAQEESEEGAREAIRRCQTILEKEPSDLWARWELAYRYHSLRGEEYDGALLEEAIFLERLSPDNPSFRMLKGVALHRNGRSMEALPYFDAKKLGPGPPLLAAYNQGLVRWELGDRERAAQDFEAFIDQFRQRPRRDGSALLAYAQALFYVTLERSSWGDLGPEFFRTVDELSVQPMLASDALLLKTQALQEQGSTREASEVFAALIRDAPPPRPTLLRASQDYLRGRSHLSRGNLDDAMEDFRSALDSFEECFLASPPEVPVPEDAWREYRGTVGALGWATLLSGQLSSELEAAAESFWHRAALGARDPEAMLNLGIAFWVRNDRLPAATALSLACRLNPELEVQKLWIWYLLVEEGREEEADVWLESASSAAARQGNALFADLAAAFRGDAITASHSEHVLSKARSAREKTEARFCLALRSTSLGDDSLASDLFKECAGSTGEYECLLAHYFLTR